MDGATTLIMMETVEPASGSAPDRDGPQFTSANCTDGDLATNEAVTAPGVSTREGVFDFNSIATRDLFVKLTTENVGNGGGNTTIATSDDDISYTDRLVTGAPDPPAALVQAVVFSGSFRYVRIKITSGASIGSVKCNLFQVGIGAVTQLDVQFKDDAISGSTFRSVKPLARLDGEVNGSPKERITYFGQDELSLGEGNSQAVTVKILFDMPSKSGQMKFVDPSTSLRKHAITLIKVYRN